MHTKSLFFICALGSLFSCLTIAILSLNFSHTNQPNQFLTSSSNKMTPIMKDTFYISHGSPTLSIDDSLPARRFLQSFQNKTLPLKPKAILIISGHWETRQPEVNSISGPSDTIHDFYGFPAPMYDLRYPAPGSPDLALKVKHLLHQSGLGPARIDTNRGLDHGAWVPLMLMYPSADIPVCQLSVQTGESAEHHFRVGRALAPLKNDGVLIVGSGAATHNLRVMNRDGSGEVAGWAREFDDWIGKALEEGRYEDVNDYEKKAPHAKMAHPRPDHFYPLHVAMGAAGENTRGELVHGSWSYGTLSYSSYRFTEKA